MSPLRHQFAQYLRVLRRKLGQHVIHTPEVLTAHYEQEDPWGYEDREDDAARRDRLVSCLRERVPNINKLRVLDVGCGEGFITRALPGAQVVGIDLSKKAIERAQAKTTDKRISYVCLDLNTAREEDLSSLGSFDIMVVTGVFYKDYLHDGVVERLLTHLKKEGWLLSSHIRSWQKHIVPYPIVFESLFSYRSYTQHLTLHQKRPVRVSIVLPVAGTGQDLPRAIASVAAQTYRPLELILIDDGYTGTTPLSKILATHTELESTLVVHEHNQGVAAGRNSGVQAATGDFITFFSADDELLPQKITWQVQHFLKQDPRVGATSITAQVIDRHGKARPYPRSGSPAQGPLFPQVLSANPLVSPMFRRSSYALVGLYNPTLRYGEDWEFHIRLLTHFDGAAVETPGIHLHTHNGQLSAASMRRVHDLKALYNLHTNTFDTHPFAHAHLWRFIGSSYADAGQFPEAQEALRTSLRIRPQPKAFLQYLLLSLSPKVFVWVYQVANRVVYGVDRWHTQNDSTSYETDEH